ncbi:zinc-dependent metalloprotease [Pseudomonadota bacterium]|uniref:zinc-dependent metalloprotease n=1 Tax=unclassified Shewanella TaxID=196818 RepID=UPI000C861BF0|nr:MULTISPECIES: zinc-dependent metalloprotease [unclassified Shewanella]MDO6774609.1 zinc-dependent metalloprotease [Shewanella sp. 3_MG-2023]PMH94559.1 metalloprotease [Shewanella sp. 10N.286.48.A6]
MDRKSMALASVMALTPVLMATPIMTYAATSAAQKVIKQSDKAQGFINFYFQNSSGELFLEANRLNEPFLLISSLPHGVGSNDIGLDRGQLGQTRMVQFERHGPYILLKQLNTFYRASSDNPAEQLAVKEAFAESVLWRGKVVEGKTPLVAVNDLMINDLHGVSQRLADTKQGSYTLDKSRSVILPQGVKSFEQNADVDVLLTFNSAKAGEFVKQVTPDGKFVSVRMRYSFVALPEAGYQPRAYQPMSGYLSDEYFDYSAPIDSPVSKQYLLRHRLEKVTPGIAPSEVVKPITYYLDPGVPEPIRSALLDGGRWWEEAFNEAGFINGFKLEILPEDADPQDIRYNMIQWVHRATRGWSYGASIKDPRTGEIIKGHVTLGSLRVKQDHLIARGLTAGWQDRDAAAEASMALALARIRQLSAHEIGHTLGLDHNFAASTNDNASVMDYPHPNITLKGEQVDISAPYVEGIGEWDKFTIAYGYGDKANADELVKQARTAGLRYIGEADSRSASASHAYASLWDNGNSAAAELTRLEQVRRKAIEQFNANALLQEQPLGELADVFVPIYLLTRFQVDAAAKWIGGSDYSYQQHGSAERWHYLSPKLQTEALSSLLALLSAESLAVPTEVTELLVPKAGNYRKTRESFDSGIGVLTDPIGMAEVMSRHVVSRILVPERLNRVNQGFMDDSEQLSVVSLIDKLLAKTLFQDLQRGQLLAVQMRVNTVVLDELLSSYHNDNTSAEVKAQLLARLTYAEKQLKRRSNRASNYQAAHFEWLLQGLAKGLESAEYRFIAKPLMMPPGSPI